jgi:hypothetical protein
MFKYNDDWIQKKFQEVKSKIDNLSHASASRSWELEKRMERVENELYYMKNKDSIEATLAEAKKYLSYKDVEYNIQDKSYKGLEIITYEDGDEEDVWYDIHDVKGRINEKIAEECRAKHKRKR